MASPSIAKVLERYGSPRGKEVSTNGLFPGGVGLATMGSEVTGRWRNAGLRRMGYEAS